VEPVDTGAVGAGEREQMGRKHVVVVNDAPEVLQLVRRLLQDERYNVTTTNYVPQTFEQIGALAPDLILVDLAAGRRGGWDLLERLHAGAATRGIPVIVTSTDRQLLDRARGDAARAGADGVLMRPFDLEELLDAIQQRIGFA
jgi:two-component system, OmpR family, response regulator MprA